MAIQIKDPTTISNKWATRAGAAAGDYTSGVNNPRTDQAQAAIAAAPVWAQSVQEAAANGSYQKGVAKAGTAKWQAGATSKGAQRYAPGVSAGKNNYVNGVTPYLNVLSNVTLPPRQVKGNNMARVQAVVDALRKQKLAGS